MIVLDEQLGAATVFAPLAAKFRGTVIYIQELRGGTTIKDEAVPSLLLQRKRPIFVTMNDRDFWLRIEPHSAYCVVCFPIASQRQSVIPEMLMRLFRHPQFRTSARRMGKIIRVTSSQIWYYEKDKRSPRKVRWH